MTRDWEKWSAIMKARWQDPEYRERQIVSMVENRQDPEYREKLGAAMKRRWQDPEQREKLIAAQKAGFTDERRAKIGAAHKGKKGKPVSNDTKAKIANAKMLPPEEDARIYDMFRAGKARFEISEETGYSLNTVMCAIARVCSVRCPLKEAEA